MPSCKIEELWDQHPAVEEGLAELFVAKGAMASLLGGALHLLVE